MPSFVPSRPGGPRRWRAVVKLDGKIRATKFFGSSEKEKRKAILWENKKRTELLTKTDSRNEPEILVWIVEHLEYAKQRYPDKTFSEKRKALQSFMQYAEGLQLADITPSVALKYLQIQAKQRTNNASNKDRKNLSAAWKWGRIFMEGFPLEKVNPFKSVDKLPEQRYPRYIPPEGDFWKIVEVAEGQDKVMLLMFYYTAARRKEIFQLQWSDVIFSQETSRILFQTKKTKGGSVRTDWLPVLPQLKDALIWWREARPIKNAKHIFVCLNNTSSQNHNYGGPFLYRQKFMESICKKAGVKPFGFHAIRHLRAIRLYRDGVRLQQIQQWLRHSSASATEKYLKRLGLDLNSLLEVARKSNGPAKIIPFAVND